MKKGNLLNGLEVVDVKRVNKLNLIQFLKEVDSYLHQGYHIDVTSARQVGLVLMADMFKTEAASSVKVGSTDVGSVGEQIPTESVELAPEESVVPESTVQQEQVNAEAVVEVTEQPKENVAVEPVEESPVVPKKTTTRSKKTAQ